MEIFLGAGEYWSDCCLGRANWGVDTGNSYTITTPNGGIPFNYDWICVKCSESCLLVPIKLGGK